MFEFIIVIIWLFFAGWSFGNLISDYDYDKSKDSFVPIFMFCSV